MKINKRKIGSRWEQAAKAYLEKRGYRIVEENFRCRQGEIDLIGYDNTVLCFIEVKYRASERYGLPGEAVDARKKLRIINAAGYYLYRNRLPQDTPCRYDAVLILEDRIELIQNAFGGIL